jgi:hypothetical protein
MNSFIFFCCRYSREQYILVVNVILLRNGKCSIVKRPIIILYDINYHFFLIFLKHG